MSSDLNVIAELERILGKNLPLASISGSIPQHPTAIPGTAGPASGSSSPEGTGDLGFDSFTGHQSWGVFLGKQESVVGLSLAGCHLPEIPEPVFKLTNLQKLNLGGNSLTYLSERIRELHSLETLQLFDNRITTLPRWILDLGLEIKKSLVGPGILVSGNPLQSPPVEIVKQGNDAIRAYFDSLEAKPHPLNEVKVLLVGDGGAGKTSLVNKVTGKAFNPSESQTHGININHWSITAGDKEVRINFWDFGGQEIMHATHQFFLSERSVYVLVLDGRKEEDAEYWLKHIESFGGDSPILVVLNKMDENPGFDINRRFLQGKYKGIVGFYPVSCKAGQGVSEFSEGLKQALGKVRIMGTTWPAPWFRVKEQLGRMKEPFVTYESYRLLCDREKINDETSQSTLVRFLHDLGVIVHFGDFHLQDTHVLDPRWLTGAVYSIINSEELAQGKGVLKLRSLRKILPSEGEPPVYPVDKHAYIVELMKKFELCYQIDEDTILVPDLLQVQEPVIEFDFDAATTIHIDYDFLPKSIIPRFIVKKHRDIMNELRWRTGVVLHDETYAATAVVRADEAAKRISIFVAGDHPRDYMTVIRSAFLEINSSFEKLKYVERIPLPDDPELAVSYEHLLWLEKEGRSECYPEGATHPYNVQSLLGTITIGAARTEEQFVELLKKVMSGAETEQTAIEKANNLITLQPNFAGIGLNLNEVIKRLFRKSKEQK